MSDRVAPKLQIEAGAKRPACALENCNRHSVVFIEGDEGIAQRGSRLRIDGVARLGSGNGNYTGRSVGLDGNGQVTLL